MNGSYVRPPCIEYESKFEHDKLKETQLTQTYVDGTTKKKKCPVFSGEYGIEALLFVEDRFNSICHQLEFTDGAELFDNFEELVSNKAESKWEVLTRNIPANLRTPQRFRQAMDDFYLSYCDNDARDTLLKYLQSFKKPYKVPAGEHSDRMETLVDYANRLPGMEPALTADQIKLLIFESYPPRWQHAYIQSGRKIANETLPQVIQYMKDEKSFTDNITDRNKRKREQDGNHSTQSSRRDGSYHGRGRGRGRGRTMGYYIHRGRPNPCRKHNGQHDWMECVDNERSPNFMPNRNPSREGRGFNRGRNQYGRGGRGFGRQHNYGGRSNNYYSNQSNSNGEQYHIEPPRQVSFQGHSGASTITNNSNHYPARAAPLTDNAPEVHNIKLVSNQYGSACSTGNFHHVPQGGRY